MAKHPTGIEGYAGSLEDLAKDIKNMRWDACAEFLGYLAKQVKQEADHDLASGKTKLPIRLYMAPVLSRMMFSIILM